jgi:hypothetical protein
MNLEKRIELMVQLGQYMQSDNAEWQSVKENAVRQNPWFIPEFIELSVKNIVGSFLQKNLLEQWSLQYNVRNAQNKKNIGIVMAGNIPMVGFHDFLCVFISGYWQTIKLSSKDNILLPHLIDKLNEWSNEEIKDAIHIAENLKGCDAYIATGSNNSSRYFEYYFGKFPNIIRKNRTSVAMLTGSETQEELNALANDMQVYFGLGCRNITKLFVPDGYNFLPLIAALKPYEYFLDFHKYKHNYDYQLALLIMGNKPYMNSGAVVLSENKSLFSPVSHVYYEYYRDKEKLVNELVNNNDIQCIAGKDFIPFGKVQQPSLTDYADGVDTMRWLIENNQ